MPIHESFYNRWRESAMDSAQFREQLIGRMTPERLRILWQGQPLKNPAITTLEGNQITILHPGFNHPDQNQLLRRAVLRMDGETLSGADIMLDPEGGCWHGQRRDLDSAYAKVKLLVTWEGKPYAPGHPPCFRMADHYLDRDGTTLQENSLWIPPLEPSVLPKTCRAPMQTLLEQGLRQLSREASLSRLWRLTAILEDRMDRAGGQSTLWHHLFCSMGYRHNQWPMYHLSQHLEALTQGMQGKKDPAHDQLLAMQARLLGCGGFLEEPVESFPTTNQDYLARLQKFWQVDKAKLHEASMPAAIWYNQGIRPSNHPQRRLATLAHWLLGPSLDQAIVGWFEGTQDADQARHTLHQLLSGGIDPFWEIHWTLHGRPLKSAKALIGRMRINELALSTLLPWLMAHYSRQEDLSAQQKVEDLYLQWPSFEDHALLEQARRRLLGSDHHHWIQTATDQIGLIQILQDFCSKSDHDCDQCLFQACSQMARLKQIWSSGGTSLSG